jgi:hypothetical protein
MKFVSIFFLVALAVATAEISLVHRAKPLLDVIQELPVNLQRARTGQSLAEALGIPDSPQVSSFETQIRSEIGDKIRDFLEGLLGNVQELGSHALDAIKELLEKLLGGGTPSEDEARQFISLVSSVQNQGEDVKQLIDLGLEGTAIGAVSWYSIEERGISDWWNKIKAWFSGIGSWISDKFGAFKSWAKDVFQKVIDAAKPIAAQLKDMALEFLKENWDVAAKELVRQAMDFFYPHSGEIGAEVMQKLIDLARKLGLTKWEQKYLLY